MLVLGKHGDGRGVLGVGAVRLVVGDDEPLQLRHQRQGHAEDRVEVEIAVGDVQDEDAVVLELAGIELQRLRRHQVHGDSVGGEGIDENEVEAAVGLLRHGEARVAHDHVKLGLAVGEEGEVGRLGGDVDDDGIDLEEAPALVLLGVAGDGAGAEPDDAEAALFARCVETTLHDLDRASERTVGVVVGAGRGVGDELAVLVADALRAVQRGSVGQ